MLFSFQKKNCKASYLIIFLLLEIFSWLSFNFVPLAGMVLVLLTLLTVYFILKKPIYALYIPVAELFWGSMGHSFDYGIFSLRLIIFLVIIFVFFIKNVFILPKVDFKNKIFGIWLFILFFVLVAIANGFLAGNGLSDIFKDSNAYFYLLYLPIWWQVYEQKYLKNIVLILLSAAIVTTLKTIWLFHIFSQNYSLIDLGLVYKWVRDTRTGEITPLGGDLYRIFMQSQIYILVAWFILFYKQIKENKIYTNFAVLTLFSTALFLSMSRSYWLGVLIGAFILLVFLYKHINIKLGLNFFYILLASFLLIQILFNIPNYNKILGLDNQRFDTSGAAVSSRQQLLQPMWQEIKKKPIMGYGFGKKITYNSSDPRIKNEDNPTGIYTTFSFEWGWLEQYLKLGVFFVFSFVIWLIMLYNKLYRLAKDNKSIYYVLGAILASFALMHVFSPYFNHPLGLGIMMLISIILYKNEPRQHLIKQGTKK